MPKTRYEPKNAIIYLRVTKTIKDLIVHQAAQEGISPSEWLRKIIVKELRERNAIPTLFKVPEVEERRKEI